MGMALVMEIAMVMEMAMALEMGLDLTYDLLKDLYRFIRISNHISVRI
jgi:hypothetical protein